MPIRFPLPRFLSLFGFGLNTFILFLAAAAGIFLWLANTSGVPDDDTQGDAIGSLLTYAALAGLVVARLSQQLVRPDLNISDPLQWLRFDEPRLSFVGGLVAATLLFVYLACRRGLRPLLVLDNLGPALLLAYGVGRLGSASFGAVTGVPWAISYEGVTLHPVQIYSLLGASLGAVLLWSMPRLRTPTGSRFALAVMYLGLLRVLVEFFTVRSAGNALSLTQWSYAILAGVAFLVYRVLPRPASEPQDVEDEIVAELRQELTGSSQSQTQRSLHWAPRIMGVLLAVLLVADGALAAVVQPGTPADMEQRPFLTYQAPDFQVVTLQGEKYMLSELRGRPVMLNFWATWCPPCKAEMPHIQQVQEKYGDRVAIVGVDLAESEDVVRQFVDAQGYSWTFAIDEPGAVADQYLVRYIPTTFFIDPNGIIRKVYTGPMSENEIVSYLRDAGM